MLTATSYSDDLNPLYVYEAKMSLLIRMSQSRAGAERLLEARRALHSTSLTSRAWAKATRNFLYRDVCVNSTVQLYLLLRSLATNPALRPLVGGLIWMGKLDGVDASTDTTSGEFPSFRRSGASLPCLPPLSALIYAPPKQVYASSKLSPFSR